MVERRKKLFSIDFNGSDSVSLPLNALQTSVFPVVLVKDDQMRSIGTCFAISNHGLCITAKHVIDEVPYIEKEGVAEVDGHLGVLYIALPENDDGSTDLLGGFIPITKAHAASGVDIAIMHLNLPTDVDTGEFIPFPAQRLNIDFPTEGARLSALGYEKGEWTFTGDGVHELSHTFTASTGFAREIHPIRRDSVVMPTPCFQTSAPFRSGMSGGPVIGENGVVVGVISTGFDTVEGEEPISYATPLAPAMGLPVEGIGEDGIKKSLFLWDFVQGGAVSADLGGATVTRSDCELKIEVGGGWYHWRDEP